MLGVVQRTSRNSCHDLLRCSDACSCAVDVYAGVWQTGGTLKASLTDGTGAVVGTYTEGSVVKCDKAGWSKSTRGINAKYTLVFGSQPKAGGKLTIEWSQDDEGGNITFQAVAFSSASSLSGGEGDVVVV